ncbi:MAG TPA: ABC transporter permease subunit [Stellaceae bacterium]|nr:ABC transporter permease subunit [Stellaceae bacterium]
MRPLVILSGVGLASIYGFLLAPLVVVVLSSLTAGELMRFPPQGVSLRWFSRFYESAGFIDALLLSLRVAAVSTVVVTLVGGMAALCHRTLSRRLGGWFRLLLLLPLLIPELLTAIGLLFFLSRIGLGKSLIGLQLGHIVITLPFAFISIAAALQQVDPALEDASDSLGASGWQTFRHILLPLIKAGALMGALFAFVTSFDMFTLSFLLKPVGGDTLPLALFNYLTYDFDPTAAAAATISILLAFAGVWVIDRTVGLRRVM